MNSGQMMLTIGALVLLGSLIIGTNSIITNMQSRSIGTEAVLTATAIGQALIEEAIVRGFDRYYQPPYFTNDSTDLTPPDSLGRDFGETSSEKFNDVDDYNGFRRTVATPKLGNFLVRCQVYYVNENSLNNPASTQTFFKKIDTHVSNQYIPSVDTTVVISKIIAYRFR